VSAEPVPFDHRRPHDGRTRLDDGERAKVRTVWRNALLRILHPEGYRDLRAFKNKETHAVGIAVENLDGVGEFIGRHHGGDIYFGVAPRATEKGRKTEDCLALYALFADLDFKDFASEAHARERLAAFPLPPSAVVASGGGLHAYWFLQGPMYLQGDGAQRAKENLRALATAVGGDLKSAEPARILRLPGTFNHKPDYGEPRPVVLEFIDGERRYAAATVLAAAPAVSDAPEARRPEPLPRDVGDGGRNNTLFREGCRLRRLGLDEAEIRAALTAINANRCRPPLDAPEVETIARSCSGYERAADTFPTTEAGDAEFFAAANEDTVRYDHRRGRWLLFDGHHWLPQTDGKIHRLALEAVRARLRGAVGDKDRMRWAIGGEARKRQTNMLALVQNMRPVTDDGKGWDADPWLLGVPNGVIDLRTGSLRHGRPEDRITMRARVPFDPNATCPLWDQTLAEIFGDREELVAYLDRLIGYSLTGDCREEMLPFCWGGGANGKGTVMNTIGWLLGDYADDLPFSALELHERAGIPNDIAKIVGKRFVTSSETGETKRLNEARVKALTGRDPITARFLHQEFFTFQPSAKFWLATNQKPIVRDTSLGFWRRIHLIPFTRSFAGSPDLQLKDKLRAEAVGILARAVRGCLEWQRTGLNPPDAIREATKSYRAASMPLARFLDERCLIQDNATATFGDLFRAYVRWCGDARESARLGRHEFSDALHEQFPTDPVSKRNVTFIGVGLLGDGGQL
jgi:putative DNA primase/helicase